MILSIYVGKSLKKIQHSFITKMLNKLGTIGNFLKLLNGIYKNLTPEDKE